MNEEQQAQYTEDFNTYFDVKEENKPGYTPGNKAQCPCGGTDREVRSVL